MYSPLRGPKGVNSREMKGIHAYIKKHDFN